MISSYRFGSIEVNGKRFTRDLIIFPDHINKNWRRKTGHLLVIDDIYEVIDTEPELLIIGTGAHGLMKIDGKLRDKLRNSGIDFIAKKTPEAVDEYNRIYKDRKVVCALHLTC
jgi:hypothetical protein